MEIAKEHEQLLLVPAQYVLDLWGLLGVRHKHLTEVTGEACKSKYAKGKSGSTDLKNVECLELDISALVAQHVHHHLEVRLICDVARHNVEVRTVQQDLAK